MAGENWVRQMFEAQQLRDPDAWAREHLVEWDVAAAEAHVAEEWMTRTARTSTPVHVDVSDKVIMIFVTSPRQGVNARARLREQLQDRAEEYFPGRRIEVRVG